MAKMAKITVTVEGSTIGSATIVTEYDKANSDRFVAWLMAQYGVDEDGNPRDLRGVVNAYWDAVKAGTHKNIVRWEVDQAKKQAEEDATPMIDP
jgi:hypothetical protein